MTRGDGSPGPVPSRPGASLARRLLPLVALLLLLLVPPLAPPPGALAGETGKRRARSLTLGDGALSFDGFPLLSALTGEVSLDGPRLLARGGFGLRGGTGEMRLSRDDTGGIEFAAVCRGIRPDAPLRGGIDVELSGGGPEGSVEARFKGTLRALALEIPLENGATAEVGFGDGAFAGEVAFLRGSLAGTAGGNAGPARGTLRFAGPAVEFARHATGELTLSARDLPLPGAAAARIGGRLLALDLSATLEGPTAEVALSLDAPLAALTCELRLSRAGELAGTAEVRADRAALGDAFRLGPLDLLAGPSLRLELTVSGSARRPEWRILRRL